MVTFDPIGNQISEGEAKECQEHFWAIIDKAFKYSNAHSADIPPNESLLDFIKLHAEGKFREPFPEAYQRTNQSSDDNKHAFLLKWAEQWGAFIGGTVSQQSLKYFWLEECLDGENLFCAGTYAKILEHVAKHAIERADIKFGHAVTKITSQENKDGTLSVTVESPGGCGSEKSFDEVIVTTPLGWLKKRKEAFEPKLPERVCQAIDSLGYGNLDKVYITFPTAFWDIPLQEHETNGHMVSERTQGVPNMTATALPIHHPTVPHPYPNKSLDGPGSPPAEPLRQSTPQESMPLQSKHYPGFTNFIAPTYAKLNPDSYTQEAINLAALPSTVAHPTLLFYTSGPTSTYIANVLKQHPADSLSRHGALWNFFKPYISLLPNYSAMDANCKPSGILATGWENDEFAGWGSYTKCPVGLEHGDEDVLALREGCPERGVWFAGEHCAPFVALGTVTGAYWSGEAVGKRILGAYGLEVRK
jgi:hypothetical protein